MDKKRLKVLEKDFSNAQTVMQMQHLDSKKIYLLDDSQLQLELLSSYLKDIPKVVFNVFENEFEVIKCCQQESPDLLICDFMLSNIDGLQVSEFFHRLSFFPKRPLLISSLSLNEIILQTKKLGLHLSKLPQNEYEKKLKVYPFQVELNDVKEEESGWPYHFMQKPIGKKELTDYINWILWGQSDER